MVIEMAERRFRSPRISPSAGYTMPAVVMDNGTGYTKMGFAGNTEPQFIIPTSIACREDPSIKSKISGRMPSSVTVGGTAYRGEGTSLLSSSFITSSSSKGAGRGGLGPLADLDFAIGEEAMTLNPQVYSVNYPVRHGLIDNWDLMERFWERSIFQYLKCEPEDHFFLLVS
jgi:actin-related protein 3